MSFEVCQKIEITIVHSLRNLQLTLVNYQQAKLDN